jgi:hypothetical protein
MRIHRPAHPSLIFQTFRVVAREISSPIGVSVRAGTVAPRDAIHCYPHRAAWICADPDAYEDKNYLKDAPCATNHVLGHG